MSRPGFGNQKYDAPPEHDDSLRPAIDDPAWVRERYLEAKELLAEIRELRAWLPAELWERIDWFHSETFMDTCTTLGPDCACNVASR